MRYIVEIIGEGVLVDGGVIGLVGELLRVKGIESVSIEKDAEDEEPTLEGRRNKVLQGLQEGLSVKEISEKTSLPKSIVYNDKRVLKKQGYDV